MLSRTRSTSGPATRCASWAYRLVPPCSMKQKWNPAVLAIACRWSPGLRSSSLRGMAGNRPAARPGTACGSLSPKSGFCESLRYRGQKLVSTVSSIRFVRRPICCAPVALLLGRLRNLLRLTGSARYFAVLDAGELVVLLPETGLDQLGRGEKPENRHVALRQATLWP